MGECKCAVCSYYVEVEANLATLPEASRPFFEDMYSRLCHAEMDRDWNAHKIKEAFSQGMKQNNFTTVSLGLTAPLVCGS